MEQMEQMEQSGTIRDVALEYDIIQGFLEGLRPVQRMTVSEWAERNRLLTSKASAQPGQWSNARTPYLVKIMDALSATSRYQEVWFMKGAQIGGTEAGNNWLGYVVDNGLGSMLMVMPTDETVKVNVNIRIDPMFEDTPSLREKIGSRKSRDSTNNGSQKNYPGGTLLMRGAKSPAGLRSVPVPFVYIDEIDSYDHNVGNEGSPVELVIVRTETFPNKKIYGVSTPKEKGKSVIEAKFLSTDQQYWHVPCPECQTKQRLEFSQLTWPEGKPEEARYKCIECGYLMQNYEKNWMLPRGEWVSHAPENASPYRIGFHLSSLYSPVGWLSWERIAAKYEDALKDPLKMITFKNTVLGETVEVETERIEWETLFERRERYPRNLVPSDVCFLTAGVDIQGNRIEFEVVGWCKGKRSYSIDYRILIGNTAEPDIWQELAQVLTETWKRTDGSDMSLALMGVDSGYQTTMVYDFFVRYPTKVRVVKGLQGIETIISPPRKPSATEQGKQSPFIQVWRVGTNISKSELYSFLKLRINPETGEIPHGYCHFPEYEPEYFKQLTSEKLVLQKDGKSYSWAKTQERNEALDCRVYARAMAEVLGLSSPNSSELLEQLKARYVSGVALPQQQPNQAPKRRKDSFW